MKDAMAQVKDELGDDAVILHTKKIKKGGILGYGAKEIFEVTAALDEVPRRPPKKREERLPTLAELQAQDASAKEPPKSAVPLPQGHAARAVQGETMTPLAVPQEGQARAVSASVATAVDPLQMQMQMPVQQATAAAQPQRRLSQSAAKSYKTAGTEAAVAEAKRQAYDSVPDVTAPVVAGKEPFVPAFPSQEQAAESFLPLVPAAEKAESLEPPVRKVRRRRAATVKRRKLRAAGKKDTLDEAAASSSAADVAPRAKPVDEKAAQASKEDADQRQESAARPPEKGDAERQQETIEALQNELLQMKAMLVQVVSKEKAPEDEMSLQQALKQQDVEPDIIEDVVLQLPAETILADKDTPLALEGLTKYLADNMQMADGLALKSRKRKIAALLGPTGVGKTTTLAKIAAQCVLEKGISTAFITADTYRISAVEQLKTYADILGLPIAIVYTPDELKEAIQKFRQKQLILIDTAGRSQHNRRQMAELKDFLAVNPNIEKYLVLSATTKNEDAKDIVDKFSVCKPDKVIFTKTDETKSLGIILNILCKKDMRLSYLTNGQSVPDDIVSAEAGKLAELFLR